jgi:hypothetical protein
MSGKEGQKYPKGKPLSIFHFFHHNSLKQCQVAGIELSPLF